MDGSEKIDMILVFGTGGMLILALAVITFVVAYQRRMFAKQNEISLLELNIQKELMQAVIQAKEIEQKRIAQDLHDGIGSALTALKMSLIQVSIEKEEKKLINAMIKSISTDVRKISNELMPSVLEDMGLQKAISNLTSQLSSSTSIIFSHEFDDSLEHLYNEQTQIALFRVIQELFNNIIKYANASMVCVTESREGNIFIILISDDGDGYAPSEEDLTKPGSLGLKNIRSRIQQIGGAITYLNKEIKGTIVNISVPIHEEN